jgi:hypothetical protein
MVGVRLQVAGEKSKRQVGMVPGISKHAKNF